MAKIIERKCPVCDEFTQHAIEYGNYRCLKCTYIYDPKLTIEVFKLTSPAWLKEKTIDGAA